MPGKLIWRPETAGVGMIILREVKNLSFL